jgi:chromosome segregation ATPase
MAEGTIEKGFILDPEARLKSRIDEQSELICILKKRTDQLLLDSKSYEKRCEKTEKTNSDLVSQLKNEKEKVLMLENRFNELADNHTEIIQYKEDYRARALRLEKENKFLRSESDSLMTSSILEKDKKIKEWEEKNQKLFEKIRELEEKNENLNFEIVELKKSETQKSVKIEKLEEKLDKNKNEKKNFEIEKENEIFDLEKKFQKKIEDLEKENQNLLITSLERGKEISLKEEEMVDLSSEIFELKSRIKSIESEWKEMKNKLSKDSTYKRLSKENDILKETLEEKERAFAAFTAHSNDLLEKERFMNKRLRSYKTN